MKLGPWILTDDGCGAYRAKDGTTGENVFDRCLFVDKTPRVRIRSNYAIDDEDRHRLLNADYLNWAQAPFKGENCFDQESRDWCDSIAKFFGYHF